MDRRFVDRFRNTRFFLRSTSRYHPCRILCHFRQLLAQPHLWNATNCVNRLYIANK